MPIAQLYFGSRGFIPGVAGPAVEEGPDPEGTTLSLIGMMSLMGFGALGLILCG